MEPLHYKTACGVLACALVPAMMTGAAPLSDHAKRLHQRSLVFDAHVHAIDRAFYNGGDIGTRKEDGQFDLPRAREGG